MKNVLIVNDEMVAGGVARVLVNMLKELENEDVNIDVLILHPHGEMLKDIPSKYTILESTKFFDVVDYNRETILKTKSLIKFIKRLYWYFLMKTGLINNKFKKERKKIIKKQYDVEIAYKEGICTVFVANGDSKKKINWVHVDYKINNYSIHHMKLLKNALDKIDVQVAQSKEAADAYKEVFDIKDDFVIINNCIDVETISEKKKEEVELSDKFNIVSVGRLHYQKAFLRMMEVLKELKDFDFTYYIVGDGEQRKEIEKKINEYGLKDKVVLVGYVDNPYKYIRKADLFLLSSLYESAPTVVYEALAIGETPIVSTRVAGVCEQLKDGLGIVVENNKEAIEEILRNILSNKQQLEKYKETMKNYKKDNKDSVNKFLKIVSDDRI